jgi:hypothetical protein
MRVVCHVRVVRLTFAFGVEVVIHAPALADVLPAASRTLKLFGQLQLTQVLMVSVHLRCRVGRVCVCGACRA